MANFYDNYVFSFLQNNAFSFDFGRNAESCIWFLPVLSLCFNGFSKTSKNELTNFELNKPFFFRLKIHRRLLYDDSQGVSEPLDENQYGVGMVSRGKHVLHINELDNAAKAHRLSALKAAMQPIVTLAPTHMGSGEWVSKYGATVRCIHTSRGKEQCRGV